MNTRPIPEAPRASAGLLSLATGVPAHRASQRRMAGFMSNVLRARLPPDEAERYLPRLASVYENSGIATRYSAIADYVAAEPAEFSFFPPNWRLTPFPSTAERMKLYEATSVRLAERVGREAIERAELSPEAITHLVFCTCTGFFAPGPDVELLGLLGLRPSTQRTCVGFMGCHAGLNGLRTGEQIVLAEPGSVVLHICLELCSLHLQTETSTDAMLSNCLFGDGCSAVVYASPSTSSSPRITCVTSASYVAPGSAGQMSWRIGDAGFEMALAAEVPRTLRRHAREFVGGLLDRARLRFEDVEHWCVHPGGPRILEGIRDALALSRDDLTSAYETLRDYGNMSSPTIFFVLGRILERDPRPGPVVLLSFGPGLTVEGAVMMVNEPE